MAVVTYSLTLTDLRRAFWRHQLDYLKRPLVIVMTVLLIAGLFSAVTLLISRNKPDLPELAGVGLLIGLAFYLVMGFLLSPLMIWIDARRQFASSNLLREPQSLEVRPEALHISAPSGESRLRWHDIPKLARNRRLLLVYQSNRLFYILPLDRVPVEMADEIETRWRARAQ